MDYTALLSEYSDTNHSLYCDAVSQIDAYYSNEEQRIQSNADNDLKKYMEDISSTFKVRKMVQCAGWNLTVGFGWPCGTIMLTTALY